MILENEAMNQYKIRRLGTPIELRNCTLTLCTERKKFATNNNLKTLTPKMALLLMKMLKINSSKTKATE